MSNNNVLDKDIAEIIITMIGWSLTLANKRNG